MAGDHRREPDQEPGRRWIAPAIAGVFVAGLVGWILAASQMMAGADPPAPKPAITVYRTVDVPTAIPSPSPSPTTVTQTETKTVTQTVTQPGTTITVTITVTVPSPSPSPLPVTVTETVTETVTVTSDPATP